MILDRVNKLENGFDVLFQITDLASWDDSTGDEETWEQYQILRGDEYILGLHGMHIANLRNEHKSAIFKVKR